jgi:cytochrome c
MISTGPEQLITEGMQTVAPCPSDLDTIEHRRSPRRAAWIATAFLIASAPNAAHAQSDEADRLVAKGRRVFIQCSACHDITDAPVAKIGPSLKGVVGRPVASVPGYRYSESLKSLSLTWDDAQLDRWLLRPADVAPGTIMAFIGLPKEEDREAVIAYLKTVR